MEKELKDRMSKSFPELTKNLDSGRTIISKQDFFKKINLTHNGVRASRQGA